MVRHSPENDFRLSKLIAEIRMATQRYADVEQAGADGYVQVTGNMPLVGYRFYWQRHLAIVAQGFGTLRARPRSDQAVDARGVYGTGSYRVVFRRALAGRGEQAVTLAPGQTVPVGFAVWNGSAGDRDGKKSVTIWQDLVLEP